MNVRKREWKNKDGKVQVRFFADFIDKATGERVREHLPECKSILAAKKAAARLFTHREKNPKDYQHGPEEHGSFTITLEQLLDRHRGRTGISDSTRKIEKGQAKQLNTKLGADTPVSRITLLMLDDYAEARKKDVRGKHSKTKVGGATIVKELKLLNQALRWGRSRNLDVIEPFVELPDVPVDKKRPRCLTREEINALLEACGDDSKYLRQAAEVCYYSGLRRAELFRLTWENIDFDNCLLKFITIKRGRSTKRHVDTVYLPKRAMQLLSLRFEALGKPASTGLVFGVPSRTWKEIETTVDLTFSDAVESAARRAGIKRHKEIGAHTLRHSCATHLLQGGVSVPDVAAHLRHRDGGALLLRTYAHVFESGLRKAAGLLAGEAPEPEPPNENPPEMAQNGTTKIYDITQALAGSGA